MPKPLLSKLIVQGAIGFFCVLFGCVYGLHTKDHIFLIMSLLIGVGSIIRVLALLRVCVLSFSPCFPVSRQSR